MKIFKNKKAVFYTLATVLFVSLYIYLTISSSDPLPKTDEMFLISSKVKTMNSFINGFEQDAQRAIYITSFTSILALTNYVTTNGVFLTNSKSAFSEAFVNGTYLKNDLKMLDNSSFTDWQGRIKNKALLAGMNISFSLRNVTLYQSDPWHVICNVTLRVRLLDQLNTAEWNRTYKFKSILNITGLEDPQYAARTYGLIAKTIFKTPYDKNYTQTKNSTFVTKNLLNHTTIGYYTNNTSAPSYLMRLQNNLSSSPYGIESLVDLSAQQAQGIPVQTKTVVDYIYWSTNNPTSKRVDNMPSWFRIDAAHETVYMVQGHTY